MSGIILITGGIEHDYRRQGNLVDRLNEYLLEKHDRKLVQVDQHAGGDKGFQGEVWMAAINYLDKGAFLDLFCGLSWNNPDSVQLLLKGEHDDRFSVY